MSLQSTPPITLNDIYQKALANGYAGISTLSGLLAWNGWTNLSAGADSILDFLGVSTVAYTAIPDPNFEQALINLGIDTNPVPDGQVLTADINGVINLDISVQNITDLTGIEDFTALQTLECYSNQLTSLHLSANTNLTTLNCSGNQLMSLNLPASTALTILECFSNDLTSLDLSANTNLTALYCNNNLLSSLDISNNTALTELHCFTNQLNSLDLSTNTALQVLMCYDNQLTDLDLSTNIVLTCVECWSNQLTSLDVSNSTALIALGCSDNQLITLHLSANTSLTSLYCPSNPSLTCIEVANAADANAGVGIYTTWQKDPGANYSENCGA
ncbi:MAG: hypothetical protein AAF934_08590 [Bacteroidota bacterium]